MGVSPKSPGGVNVRDERGREGREEGGEANLRGDMQKEGGGGEEGYVREFNGVL